MQIALHMKLAAFLLTSYLSVATTSDIHLGTYSSAPEVHDSVAFELLENGKALVISDYFDRDGKKNTIPKSVDAGSWSYKDPFLTIRYAQHKDTLRKEDCPQKFPCFKFEKSEGKGLSPLNAPYGFGLRE